MKPKQDSIHWLMALLIALSFSLALISYVNHKQWQIYQQRLEVREPIGPGSPVTWIHEQHRLDRDEQ